MVILNSRTWAAAIPKPKVFIDAGVKKIDGIDTTLESKIVYDRWPDVSIIGFEPHPIRFKECKDKYPGKLLNFALGKRDGDATFYDLDSMAVHYPRVSQDHSRPFNVTVRSLDSLHTEMGPWSDIFIWSDTEGCEHEILLGAENLLSQDKVIGLNLELWDKFQAEGWALSSQVVDLLKTYGFEAVYEWEHAAHDPHRDVIFLRK